MKILVISNLYPPYQLGGYEIACRNVVNGLRKIGHEVHVLTSPSHLCETELETSVFRQLELRAFQPATIHSKTHQIESSVTNYTNTSIVLNHIKSFEPDCVFPFNVYGLGGLGILDALNSLNLPWVMYLMDRVPEMMKYDIHAAILAIFDAQSGGIYRKGKFISISSHLLSEIESMCKYGSVFDTDFVRAWSSILDPVISRNYGDSGILKFVNAGALLPHKGIDLIIEAAALLKDKGINNFRVDFYGEGNQGFYIDMCKQYKVFDRIFFNGLKSQVELSDIYRVSDAFLFPTHEREPFAFAPVEAAAVGCVPIMTGTCGNAEGFVDGIHCLKIKRSGKSLAFTMAKICENPLILRDTGKSTQVLTRQDLSFEHSLNNIEQSLKTAIFRKSCRKKLTWKIHNLCYLKHNLTLRIATH